MCLPSNAVRLAACCASHPQKFVEELGREALQEVYEQAVGSAPELTAKSDRPRSLGGQFINLARSRMQQEKMRCGEQSMKLMGIALVLWFGAPG